MTAQRPVPTPASTGMPPAEDKPVYEALHLTNGGVTANIVHLGQAYTLRITRQGKLILTK